MEIKEFFHQDTATVTYLVIDPASSQCALIDTVLDYDPAAGKVTTDSVDKIIRYITERELTLSWILETHIHADHLTAASYVKQQLGGQIGIGERIIDVIDYWAPVFNVAAVRDPQDDNFVFDVLFADNATFTIGNIQARVLHTPGHTPACVSYLIEDAVFVGDTIFMPDVGTARTDFPGGDAATLYRSIQRLFALPEETRIFVGHDYPPQGRQEAWESTVAEQKAHNTLLNQDVSEQDFVTRRNNRDEGKAVPRLLLPSIQVNMNAGHLPVPENNGVRYIKIPIRAS
jgi:glyoxylase-like metal-dependent hydrolase (beta-lactamase superfamily II)